MHRRRTRTPRRGLRSTPADPSPGPKDPARRAVVPLGLSLTLPLGNYLTSGVGNYLTQSALKLELCATFNSRRSAAANTAEVGHPATDRAADQGTPRFRPTARRSGRSRTTSRFDFPHVTNARRRRSESDGLLRPARMRCLGRSQVCPWALNDARRALPQGVSASDVVHLALHRRRDGALSPGTPSITRTSAATRTRSSSAGMPPRAPLSRWERPIGWPSAIAAR